MEDFAIQHKNGDHISVYFNIEANEVLAIGKKMEEIEKKAYMNGYNWEAFLHSYLSANHPDLLDGLETDSEAGTYVALYNNAETKKADKLVTIIDDLIGHPGKLYDFLKENGDKIDWA